MNIQELVNNGNNIMVSVTLNDLKEFAEVIIETTKRELEEAVISDKAETYPSSIQVCEILNVSAPTLWRWQKRGYLVPVFVGGKRRYKMSEVKAMLNGESVTTKKAGR